VYHAQTLSRPASNVCCEPIWVNVGAAVKPEVDKVAVSPDPELLLKA
jgi:hypothetical protein